MHTGKIAVFGASGLVGSRLCESLHLNKRYDFRAIIHTPGNAFGIAKYPMDIRQANMLDRDQVYRSLEDCTVVVNCSRGDKNIMLQGLKNLVHSAKKRKIRKFIHVSSVLIYGTKPPQESSEESCPPNPGGNDYGMIKLQQDDLVLQKTKSFQSILLCPPNIYGPYSGFTYAVMDYLRSGTLVLVDEGRNPCNLVHVDNLVSSMYAALGNNSVSGERFFIRDEGSSTWKEFFLEFAKLMNIPVKIVNVDSSSLPLGTPRKAGFLESLSKMAALLPSSEFRKALSRVPLFKNILDSVQYRISCLNPRIQKQLRERLSAPIIVEKEPDSVDVKHSFVGLQARTVLHSVDKAKNVLGYKPAMNIHEGLEQTKIWMQYHNFA